MDPVSAEKLVAALDLELARRQSKKDAGEEQRWLQEHGDDPSAFLGLNLSRLADRVEKWAAEPKLPEPKLSDDEREVRDRQFDEMLDSVSDLIEVLERLAQHEEAEASGIVHKPRRVGVGPRLPHLLDREPKVGPRRNQR